MLTTWPVALGHAMRSAMSLSTHVLDAALGQPAAGVPVVVQQRSADQDEHWAVLAAGATDADGRLRPTSPDGGQLSLPSGVYRIEFDTAAYFAARGQAAFYPLVSITFEVVDPDAHHHVPLLLSPFAYTTYRGS